MPIVYDEGRAPLMNTVWTGEPTVEDAVGFTQWMTKNFAKGKPFAVIIDVTQASSPGARVLTTIADFAKANTENDKKYVAGFAYVISSALVRVVIKGFLALAPNNAPRSIHENHAAAEAWALERLKETGYSVR